MDLKIQQWEDSYSRGENYMFYPKEESIKFINRFVRKKIGADRFIDVIYKGSEFKSGVGVVGSGESSGDTSSIASPHNFKSSLAPQDFSLDSIGGGGRL